MGMDFYDVVNIGISYGTDYTAHWKADDVLLSNQNNIAVVCIRV